MTPFESLLLSYRLLPQQILRLDADLFLILKETAAAQDKSVAALATEMLYTMVYENQTRTRIDERWGQLTHREQQIAALACLGYTNHEIARQLVISVNTVRSHVRNILEKYGVSSKAELRLELAHWDFQAWIKSQP